MAARVKLRPAAASVQDHLAELAERHRELVEQRDLTLAAPATPEEAKATIAAAVAAMGARAHAWGFADYAVPHGSEPSAIVGQLALCGQDSMPGGPQRPTAADLLAAVMPDALGAWLEGQLPAIYAGLPAPIAAEERMARLTELERAIAAVEGEAAEAWWQAIDAGLSLPPPAIVTAAAALGLEP